MGDAGDADCGHGIREGNRAAEHRADAWFGFQYGGAGYGGQPFVQRLGCLQIGHDDGQEILQGYVGGRAFARRVEGHS